MGACEMGKRTKMIRVGLLCVINFLAQLLPSYLYILFRIHPKSWWCCLCVCVCVCVCEKPSPHHQLSWDSNQFFFFEEKRMQALEELHMNVDHNMRSTATRKAQARSHTTTTRYEVGQNVTAARVGKIETPRPYLPFTDLNPCLPGFFLSLQALATSVEHGTLIRPCLFLHNNGAHSNTSRPLLCSLGLDKCLLLQL